MEIRKRLKRKASKSFAAKRPITPTLAEMIAMTKVETQFGTVIYGRQGRDNKRGRGPNRREETMVGDAQDQKRYAELKRLRKRAASLRGVVETSGSVSEVRRAISELDAIRRRTIHLFA